MPFAKKPELKLGYAEYVLFPDDGKRHEIIDGAQLVLRDGVYAEAPHGDELPLAVLPGVAISLSEIW